jgi:hypothetical protein
MIVNVYIVVVASSACTNLVPLMGTRALFVIALRAFFCGRFVVLFGLKISFLIGSEDSGITLRCIHHGEMFMI